MDKDRVAGQLCLEALNTKVELDGMPGRVVRDRYRLEPPDDHEDLIDALRQESALRLAQRGSRPVEAAYVEVRVDAPNSCP